MTGQAKSVDVIQLYVDGASRGNPGPAAGGMVLLDADGTALAERGVFLGVATNNVAEYRALLAGLELAAQFRPRRVEIFADSELMVRQIIGEYRVKSPDLLPLFEQVQGALLRLDSWQIRHLPRGKNVRADKLANLALNRKADVDEATDQSSVGATEPERPAGPVVTVKTTLGSDPRTCPAVAVPNEVFCIDTGVPAGLCIHAASAIVPAALELLDKSGPAGKPATVACPRCGARFELRVAAGRD